MIFDRRLLPIGIDDFGKLRGSGLFYIDKTRFIRELIDRKGVEVFLFPRPRRFGKTLAMTMLKAFFEKTKEPRSAWFEGLEIWNAGPVYREHFQRYPLIYVTLKDVKETSAEAFFEKMRKRLSDLYQEHIALLDQGTMNDEQRARFHRILSGQANQAELEETLLDLCAYLHRAHGERVVLLIDEYDTAIHEAYLNGFAEPVIGFFRRFLGSALKGNAHLYKAVLTGILRISKESIFSDLNNLSVYSILRSDYSDIFGFTESEVSGMLEQAGMSDKLGEVRDWYNGYLFGGRVMYNPWSLLNYVADGAVPRTYWVNTSANSLIKQILIQHAGRVGHEMEVLLSGGEVTRTLEENTALGDLSGDVNVLYSLLTFAGYLKARALPSEYNDRYALSIPNREVHAVYRGTFSGWLSAGVNGRGGDVQKLVAGLLKGNAKEVEKQMQRLAMATISYHDTALPDPERFYHGFVLGLLTTLEPEYRVRSNRESGDGRPDVLVIPADKGKAGVVLELKVAEPEEQTLEQALDEGEAQIQGKSYAAELEAQGVGSLIALVVAFDGKTVRVRRVG